MHRTFLLIGLFLLAISSVLSAQALTNVDVYLMKPHDADEQYISDELPRSFFVYDELAENLLEELDPKGKKGSYRAKVEVDGFKHKLKLRLSEGCRNEDGTAMRTFGTNNYRSDQRETLQPNENWGLHIYVNESKWLRKPAITSPEEERDFVKYLQGFL